MNTIETISNSPFRHLVSTIGELPTSFTESMSYYEMLAWLCDYIEKTVIPAVNNNAEAVKELQDLFVELQNYVDNYFDNLDVQEEINNKLDAMAEGGQLQEVISAYLNLKSMLTFDTVAAMKLAENLIDGCFVETLGFYAKDDRGGAKYKVRELTNQDTVDERFLIALLDTDLVAELIESPRMYVTQYGIKNDGSVDVTNDFQSLIDLGKPLNLVDGTYLVEGSLDGAITMCGESQNSIIDGGVTKHNVIDCSDPTSTDKVYLSNIAFKNATVRLYAHNGTAYQHLTTADKRNIFAQNIWFDEPVEGDGATFWGLYIKTPKPEDYTAYGNSGYACYPIEIVNNSGYNALMIDNVCTNSEGTAQAASENSAIGIVDKVIGSSPTIFVDVKTGNAARHPVGINSNVGASSAKYTGRVFDINPAGHIGIGTSCDGDDTAMSGYYTVKIKDEYASIAMKRTDSSENVSYEIDTYNQPVFKQGSSTIAKVTRQGFGMRYTSTVNDLTNLAADPNYATYEWEWRGVSRWVESIHKPVWWDGSAWRDASGTIIKSY